jgi:hypothetical protein
MLILSIKAMAQHQAFNDNCPHQCALALSSNVQLSLACGLSMLCSSADLGYWFLLVTSLYNQESRARAVAHLLQD